MHHCIIVINNSYSNYLKELFLSFNQNFRILTMCIIAIVLSFPPPTD